MKRRMISILLAFSLLVSVLATVSPAKAQDPFPSPDADGDGLANELETAGWYNLAGGPFFTDPRDLDSDNDGLTDGEEKLFDTNPLDSHSPGIAARYDNNTLYNSNFNTLQYFSTTDPAYLSIKQGGDQYLMTEALVVRRGNTFTITGPANGTLTLTGTGMTTITPVRDPARGGWTITIPANGTVGTYTATVAEGGWTKSIPVYVIFELPTDLPQAQIDAFLYDGDPGSKRDEVAVWFRTGYWNYYGDHQETVQPCPQEDPNTPCSLWAYHISYGMAQAYWTEQFTKSAFVDHAIKAIHGKNSQLTAVPALASWTDVELYTHAGTYQNNWSSSIYRYFDGTGYTMGGGDCETAATTFTALLRSAGIASRPFIVDYVKTVGHGDPTWLVGEGFEYDTTTMMWINGEWYAQRAYGADELTVDKYYPFNSGTTALQKWSTVGRSGGTWYYNDEYGNVVVAVNENWDFQNGSNGGGVVNTVWPVTTQEFAPVNRDYQWDSKKPLEITQSPSIDVFNHQNWFGDNWANTEWRTPVVSNPASPARDETLTYILPVGVPDPATPLENFPYNPQVASCSASTSTADCNAFKASINLINLYITQSNGGTITATPALSSYEPGSTVEITATPAAGYDFGAWTGACAGQANPCTLTMNANRTLGATFTQSGPPAIEGSTVNPPPTPESTEDRSPSRLDEKTTDLFDSPLPQLSDQTNEDIQFGKILKDYGLDTDQDGRFDQLVIEVEITSAIKGDYQLSGQLFAGEKSFRTGRSVTLKIGKQTVTLAFEGLPIGNNQADGPYEVQTLWIAEKDQPVGPFFLPEEMLAFENPFYKTSLYRAAEFEVTEASLSDVYSHQGVDKNRNGEYESIIVDVGLNIVVPGAFQVEGDLFDARGDFVSHAAWTGSNDVASLQFDVAKSQPPYSIGNLVLISKIGRQNGPMLDSRTYKAYEITDMDGKIEGGAVEFAQADTISSPKDNGGSIGILRVETVEPSGGAFTITPVDTNGNGKYDILRVNVSVKAAATDILGNYRIEALLEDDDGNEVAWAVSGGQPILPSRTQTMTLDFDGKMLYDQLPLTGGKALKLVAVKIFSGNLSQATLESEVKYAMRTPVYTRSQFEATSPAITVFQDDMENGADQWSLTESNVAAAGMSYRVDIGAAVAGTFTLTVDSQTTAPLAWNVSSTNLRTALTNAGITSVSAVTGSGTLTAPWVITITGAHPLLTMDKSGLVENVTGAGTSYRVNTGYAVGGTFSLTVDSNTTEPVAWNVTAANLKTALINAGITTASTVSGYGTLASPWVITFTAAPSTVTIDKSGLIENLTGAGTVYNVNIGPAIGGTFLLTVDSMTTAPIAWNALPATVMTALTNAGIPTVSTVTGSGTLSSPWVITFTEAPIAIEMDKTSLIENVIGVNKLYTVNIGSALGGTFSLTVDSNTTTSIPWNISAANLKTALNSAGITVPTVTGSGTPSSPWVITITGTPTVVTMDKTGLTGANSLWSREANADGADTVYRVNIGPALGGHFTLTVDSKSTAPIVWNSTAANLKTALTSAGVTTVSTVTGSGLSSSPWVITFTTAPSEVMMDSTGLVMASLSGSYVWKANTTVNNATQQLALATPLDLRDYASPVIRFNYAYQLGNVNDKAILEASQDGTVWKALKTYTGVNITPHWNAEEIDLSAYGEMENVSLRFNAQRANATGSIAWYVDDVTINAWPGVKTVSIIPPAVVEEGIQATFTAAYTSIDTSLPVTYKWSIDDQEFVTTSPTFDFVFSDAGDIPVTLTVSNPYDSTAVTQVVTVMGNSENVVLKTIALPSRGGTVTRVPDLEAFTPGSEVSLTAEPAQGYTFTGWSGGGCSGTGPCTVTMNTDTTVTAQFTLIEYTLNILADGPGMVTRIPDKTTYHYGDVVQLTAEPAATYGFSQWEGDVTGSTNPASITINGNKSVTAKFIQGYSLAVSPVGNGTVTKYPDQATYLPGQQVTLSAFPGTNWEFSAWSGACTGSGACVVTMNRSTFVTATFTQKRFNLDIYALPVGDTTSSIVKDPDQESYTYGQRVILTPNPELGWYFKSWGRDLTGSTSPSVVTIDGNKIIYATFSNSYSFPAPAISPSEAGTVQKTASGYSNNATTYRYGAVVTVTATPAAGRAFDHWGGSCTGQENPCVLTVAGNESVTAYFVRTAYTHILTVEETPGGTVTPNPTGGSYETDTIVTLTAAPATGHTFGQWNGDCAGQGNPCTLTMEGSKTVSATFIPTTYTLTMVNNPSEGGGTTTPEAGVTTYPHGTVVNILPNPAVGYKFDRWTGNCTGTGSCVLTMTSNRTVTANFLPVNHDLTIAVDPSIGGITTPAVGKSPYLEGSVVDVTATPIDGYEFAEWSGACTGVAGCAVTMDMPKTVTAIFAKDLEHLTVDISGNGIVIQNPPPPYHTGDSVILTKDPDHNWEFSAWGGACEGQGDSCTLVMDSDKAVSATFVENLCSLPQNLVANNGTLREDFESLDGWTVIGSQTGYSATIDTTHFKSGNSSMNLTPPSTYGYVSINKTVNWDMSAPDERGNFRFWVYVDGTTEPVDFAITLANNQQYSNTFVAYYNAAYKFQYLPGWNLVNMRASDWTSKGSPSWDQPIVNIRITVYGTSVATYSIDGFSSGAKPIPGVILTFDDAHSTLWSQAYAYMEPKNLRGTGYVITDQVGTIDRVTWPQLQEIYATGWTVGNHTRAHTYLDTLPLSGQETELAAARAALNAHGMANVDYVAYPWGSYNADTLTAMQNLGMRSGRSLLNFNNLSPLTNPYEIAQKSVGRSTTWETTKGYIDKAISRREIVVLTLHDIGVNPTSSGMYIESFQQMVDYLISQGVPILTMDDLYRLQSSEITIPRPVNGTCWDVPSTTEFTLSYTAGTGGTLEGEALQTVNSGADGTEVTAKPNTGYHFVDWSDGVLTAARTDTNVMADLSVTAKFAQDTYTLSYTAGTGGTLEGEALQTVNSGADGTEVTAKPNTGYHFVDWSDGVLTAARTDTHVIANLSVTANFAQNAYTLSVVSAHGTVSLDPVGPTYTYGTDVVLTMGTVDAGWTFTGWSGGSCSGTDPCTVNIIADTTVTANFAQNAYTLSYTAGTGGTLEGEALQTVNYGADGTQVTAKPNIGYHFVDWSDGVTTAARTDTAVIANLSVTANFAQNAYTLNVVSAHGTVSLDPVGPIYTYGTDVILTMGAVDAGWTFTGWSGAGCSGTLPCTVNMIADTTVTANFTQNAYTLSVVSAHGKVSVDPDQVSYIHGTDVVLTMGAVDAGWTFTGWSGGSCSGTDPCTVNIIANTTVTATFSQEEYSLNVGIDPAESGNNVTLSHNGPYHLNDEVTLEAEAAPGWEFDHWLVGSIVVDESVTTVTITGHLVVTAYFTQLEYALEITQATGGTITADPPGAYHLNDEVTLTATPAAGWNFSAWTGDCAEQANPCMLTLDAAKSVSATFTQYAYTLSVVSEHGAVSIAPDQPTYTPEIEVVLTMGAVDAGWTFTGWSGGGCSGTDSCYMNLTADTTVTANFMPTDFTLTVIQPDHGSIAPTTATYSYGTPVQLIATPAIGYQFEKWTGDCSGQTSATCSLTLYADKTVSAIFRGRFKLFFPVMVHNSP